MVVSVTLRPSAARLRWVQRLDKSQLALNFAYDPGGDAFTYTNSGPAASYTLGLSTVDSEGKTVEFTTQPVQISAGETHTIAPTWAQLSSGAGTVQIRSSTGAVTNNPLR